MKFALLTLALLVVVAAADSAESALRGATSLAEAAADESQPVAIDVSGDTVGSVWKNLVHSLGDTLGTRTFQIQRADAAVALIIGLLMLFNGEIVFKWVIVVATGVLVMLVAMSELSPLGLHGPVHSLVALEVFVVATYTASKGLDGVMLGAGALAGFFLASKLQPLLNLVVHDRFAAHQDNITAVWYSLCVLGCMAVVARKRYARFLAIISSIVGGALVSSAVAWVVMYASAHGHLTVMEKLMPGLKPGVLAPWYKFFFLLVSSDAEDVGLFANTPSDMFHGAFNLDRVVGLALWFVLFLFGTARQFHSISWEQACAKEVSPLAKPLLEE